MQQQQHRRASGGNIHSWPSLLLLLLLFHICALYGCSCGAHLLCLIQSQSWDTILSLPYAPAVAGHCFQCLMRLQLRGTANTQPPFHCSSLIRPTGCAHSSSLCSCRIGVLSAAPYTAAAVGHGHFAALDSCWCGAHLPYAPAAVGHSNSPFTPPPPPPPFSHCPPIALQVLHTAVPYAAAVVGCCLQHLRQLQLWGMLTLLP